MSDRQIFIEQMDARLNEWDAEVNRLNAKAERMKADAKADLYKRVDKIKELKDRARTRLEEARKTGEDKWSGLKVSAERARDDFQAALNEVQEFVSKHNE